MYFEKVIKKIFVLILVFTINSFAQGSTKSTNGFPMLKLDVGGRAAGMAGAFSAIASDASAVFWNPAGLVQGSSKSFFIMHNVWIADITQEFAAFRFNSGSHNLGVFVNLMTIPGIQIRGEVPTEEPDGEADAYTFSAGIGYGREIKNGWHAGMNIKYLFEKYYLEQAPGYALDLGLRKENVITDLDWGITLQNLGKMNSLKNTETPLPLMLRTGFAYHLPWQITGNNPILAGEIQHIKDEGSYFRVGSELDIFMYFSLRIGWISGESTNHPTAGFGLNYNTYHFDYAFVPVEYDLGNSHRISLNINF